MHNFKYIHTYLHCSLVICCLLCEKQQPFYKLWNRHKICHVDSLICGLLGMASLSVLLASAVHCQAIVRLDFGSAMPKTILLELWLKDAKTLSGNYDMKHQWVLMAGGFFSGCSQVILKASVSKLIQCPCQCERSPPIMDLALKRIPLPRASASDPSPLGEIFRNSWKKTGTIKFRKDYCWRGVWNKALRRLTIVFRFSSTLTFDGFKKAK